MYSLVSSDVTFFLSHENHSACSAIPPPFPYPTHDPASRLNQGGHECHVCGWFHVLSASVCFPTGGPLARTHTRHYSIMQETTVLSTGFDSQLAMNTATLRRQHRIPSDLRS